MNLDTNTLKEQIPHYLSAEDQRLLVTELNAISRGGSAEFVLSAARDQFREQMLQGDGWRGFVLFSFETGERRSVAGLVLSNSCDIDPNNPRDLPTKVTFAPLARLSTFVELLTASGISSDRIASKVDSIKSQRTTNIFYLPAGSFLRHDYVIRFDDALSMPVSFHEKSSDRGKLFTLNNTGFYMLVLKLSIHFCRLQEKINRKHAHTES
jgi:hypothetical protein